MKSNRGKKKNECCDSFMGFNPDGSLTCNECGNEWVPFLRNLGGSGRKARLKGLVRLTLLRNRDRGPMSSAEIVDYIKAMKYRNAPTTNQVSNFCSADPHILKTEAHPTATWKIVFDDLGER